MPLHPLPPYPPPYCFPSLPSLSSLPASLPLSLALLSLAPLTSIPHSTVLHGTSPLLDALIITPGIYLQQTAPALSQGEYPACGALTTGYVFRVENEGTVFFLQRVGMTGTLTTLHVERLNHIGSSSSGNTGARRFLGAVVNALYPFQSSSPISTLCHLLSCTLTILTLLLLVLSHDVPALLFLSTLIIARLLNTWGIRRRVQGGWHGASEPNVHGDLLVLLSQDRWVRMKGLVDDLKTITSGSWLRQPTLLERCLTDVATLLVYLSPGLAASATPENSFVLILLLLTSTFLLVMGNETMTALSMHGCKVSVKGERRAYGRRLEMVQELLHEDGRNEGAMRKCFAQMGMNLPGKSGGKVTM